MLLRNWRACYCAHPGRAQRDAEAGIGGVVIANGAMSGGEERSGAPVEGEAVDCVIALWFQQALLYI